MVIIDGFLTPVCRHRGLGFRMPVRTDKEYDEYPVVPRIGEEVITDFASSGSDGRWLVRAVRHLIRQGTTPEGVIVDLIPVHH
jgi:hypothetical protein